MTLSTIEAIIKTPSYDRDIFVRYLNKEYIVWRKLQNNWYQRRAPGDTCMNSIDDIIKNEICTIDYNIKRNNSKGCGGIMRVAPIGFLDVSFEDSILLGIDSVYITHNGPLGYYPAGFLTGLIHLLYNNNLTIEQAVYRMIDTFENLPEPEVSSHMIPLVKKAISLTKNNKEDILNINEIGEGWTADETLALSIYCSVKYERDSRKALITSVNINGDSDSVGCVTGAILGTVTPLNSIPSKWLTELKNINEITSKANELVIHIFKSSVSTYN